MYFSGHKNASHRRLHILYLLASLADLYDNMAYLSRNKRVSITFSKNI